MFESKKQLINKEITFISLLCLSRKIHFRNVLSQGCKQQYFAQTRTNELMLTKCDINFKCNVMFVLFSIQ